jgi:hypothetical protein
MGMNSDRRTFLTTAALAAGPMFIPRKRGAPTIALATADRVRRPRPLREQDFQDLGLSA